MQAEEEQSEEMQSGEMAGAEPFATFPAGVASFDPTTDGVLLWTLCTAPGELTWELAADDAFAQTVAGASTRATTNGSAVTVEVTGLDPGRTYWYRFTSAGETSPIGQTRTLPAGEPDRLRIGFTTCARFGQARFHVYRALATEDVDLVVHLGDYIYEDTKSDIPGREPEPDHDCVTLEDYRARHLQSRRDPDLQLLHQRHPMVVVWDDHDFADNAARDGAQNHDESEQGPWSDRLAAALQAHQEFLPKRLAVGDDPATAWRHLDAGTLARVVCTETRAHRDTPAGVPDSLPLDDPNRTLLGDAQRGWLTEALADRGPRWTLLLSGTVVSELTVEAPDFLDVLPEKYLVEDGRAMNTDQWDGYPADRALLVDAARRRGGATVVFSGDIHSSWAIEGPGDEHGAVAVEFTCPPAATTPFGTLLPEGAVPLLRSMAEAKLPAVRWLDAEHRGYVVADVARERVAVSHWWVDADDEAADDEERPGSLEVRLGRRWEVPHGGLPVRLVDPDPRPTEAPSTDPRDVGLTGSAPSALLAGAGALLAAAAVGAAVAARRALRRHH